MSMGRGVLGRGGWARLRRSSFQGRRGRQGWPCARNKENPEAQRARVRHAMQAQERRMCMRNTTKWGATAFA
eukprot:5366013-Pleurochrysis_carterae.AAC.1